MNRLFHPLLMLHLCLLCCLIRLPAADWPKWRGPDANGISSETDWNPGAILNGGKALFRTQLGSGWSAVSVRGNRLYSMGNVNNQDIVYCLNAKTGQEIWQFSYGCATGNYPGPRSTPVLDEGRVYSVSREGHLFCLNAESGKVIWKHHLAEEFKAVAPTWGFAGSAVIEGDMLIVNAGVHGMAFEKNSGKFLWGTGGTGGYSTPVLFTHEGKRVAVLFSEVRIYGVDAVSGKVLWSYDWETEWHVNAADPLVIGDLIFISSGYNRGSAMLRVAGNTVQTVWIQDKMSTQFSSPIHLKGYLYCIDGNVGSGHLKCLDVQSGQVQWTRNTGFGSLISAAGRLIVLNEKGTLTILEADPSGYREIAVAQDLLKAKCWNAPVLSDGVLYLRNNSGELLALNVRS
jgi:outer membrane protein assembly factor BamB